MGKTIGQVRGASCAMLMFLACLLPGAAAAAKRDMIGNERPVVLKNSPRLQVGKACAERLGSFYTDGAGPFVTARAGDWRLSNEFISATFAAVEPISNNVSQPVGGHHELVHPEARIQGALIDVAADGEELDFMGSFTQGIGLAPEGLEIQYDSIKPVKRAGEVGLQLEGSPFDASLVRLQTTYWLAPGSHRIRIETVFLDLPADEPAPQVSDVGHWGVGRLLVENHGLAMTNTSNPMLADFYLCQGGNLCLGIAPVAGDKAEGIFTGLPPTTRATYVIAPPEDKVTTTTKPTQAATKATTATAKTAAVANKNKTEKAAKTLVPTPKANESKPKDGKPAAPKASVAAKPATPAPPRVIVRDLWIVRGNSFAPMTQTILADRKIPTGTVIGQVYLANPVKAARLRSAGIPGAVIEVKKMDPAHLENNPKIYTTIMSDKNGRYNIVLPKGHYFLVRAVKSRSKVPVPRIATGCDVVPGKTIPGSLQMLPEAGVHIRVMDEKTSRPLAARLRFEPIAPTLPIDFGFPLSASGYVDNAYIPEEGTTITLNEGRWTVYATHGIRYELADQEFGIEKNKITQCTIKLREVNPTPGWLGMEIGARTRATPGCTIDPQDWVLMAAGEGIEWIVSGDFEKLTDFAPLIKKAGLTGKLGSSRGFRTMLPAHPEWGQFLIYPIHEASADPAIVRHEWQNIKTAHEFITTLRRLYPEAMIQCDLPYTTDGQGYFAIPGQNPYQISFDPDPAIDPNVDALSVFSPRRAWDIQAQLGFFMNNLMRCRNMIPAPSSTGRTVFGAEPGYPRLLVYTGKDSPTQVTEAAFFSAIRAHRIQLTTGPFIDFKVGDTMAGGLTTLDPKAPVRLRVTSPEWIPASNMIIQKEDALQLSSNFGNQDLRPQRYPPPDTGDKYAQFPLSDLRMLKLKDTLLSVMVVGSETMSPNVPAMQGSEQTLPFALTWPIVIDANGNKKYDPLPNYTEKGR